MPADAAVELRRSAVELEAAQQMQAWFGDYLYGLQEHPGPLPDLTVSRLDRQFGRGERAEQLALIRDELMIFDAKHQPNLALYICGYPDDALEILGDGDILEMLRLLDERFPIPTVEEVVMEFDAEVELNAPEEPLVREKRPDHTERLGRKALAITDPVPRVLSPPSRPDYSSRRQYVPASPSPINLGIPRVRPSDVDDDNPLSWQTDALCAQTDPEAFFPEKGGSTRDAKRICTSCDVKHQCLEYALQNDERFGIWGGLSERERRRLRRTRSA